MKQHRKLLKQFIHIGYNKIVSKNDIIGIFNIKSLINIDENEGVFPDIFDEDDEILFKDSQTIVLYIDGFYEKSKIKPETLIRRS